MREILFRGKCKDTGKWYEGDYIHLHKTTYCFKEDYDRNPDNDMHHIVFEKMMDWGLPNQHLQADVLPESVGQYTGLTDKNGKKIFEGDIVECNGGFYQIVFEDGCFGAYQNEQYFFTLFSLYVAVEVIGNIHDNPELLKGVVE